MKTSAFVTESMQEPQSKLKDNRKKIPVFKDDFSSEWLIYFYISSTN